MINKMKLLLHNSPASALSIAIGGQARLPKTEATGNGGQAKSVENLDV